MAIGTLYHEIQFALLAFSCLLLGCAGIEAGLRNDSFSGLRTFFESIFGMGREKRGEERVTFHGPIEMVTSGRSMTGVLINISQHGACLSTNHPIKRHQRVLAWMTASSGVSTGMAARVMWCKKLPGRTLCGIRFESAFMLDTRLAS